jgi:hypothetical protein
MGAFSEVRRAPGAADLRRNDAGRKPSSQTFCRRAGARMLWYEDAA